jgi:hypothetical protein
VRGEVANAVRPTVRPTRLSHPVQDWTYYFPGPAGTARFSVSFVGPSEVAGRGQPPVVRFDPKGIAVDPMGGTSCYIPSPSACEVSLPNTRHQRTTLAPIRGVSEITVEARRTSDAIDVPYTLTVSVSKEP